MLELPSDIPSTIPANAKIYKDDCMYSFDTPENNEFGLDIDLKSYFAYSRNATHNYTRDNYEKTGNYLYLNINKVLKPESERKKIYDENGEKSTKLQKLEIKDIDENELYNVEYTVYDIKQDKSYRLDELSDPFRKLIDQILTSNSSHQQDEIKQWELEIIPCHHSIDIQQETSSKEIDLTKCSVCELKENLWICLHCGALGCGRQQFGSNLKGNGHALNHYEITGHPVAVKLGSLSSDNEDSCDVYCYACNDEVKVPKLSEKLFKFGIDLKSQVKTEKSLIELNIYQNLNWDFKLEGANGEKLKPVYGKGYTGFQNLGNSCYLNSVLQSLFSLDNYQQFFSNLSSELNTSSIKNPSEDLSNQLIKIYDGLWSGRYSKPSLISANKGDDYQLGLKPVSFKTLIGENHAEFKTQRQQDAFEFLLYLLDKLDQEFGLTLNQSLKFLFANKTICANCQHGSIQSELIDNLSIPIKHEVIGKDEDGKKLYEQVNLIESIRDYCDTEGIEGYKCDHCKVPSGLAIKSGGFKTYPDVLVVSVQRIILENWVPIKIDVPIEIPYEIDLGEFKEPIFEGDEVEVEQKDEEEEVSGSSSDNKFKPNEEALSTLLSMGFPEPRCLKGLYHGNNNAEDAMNWIFAHMDDIDIDEPFNPDVQTSSAATTTDSGPSQDSIDNLVGMGFSTQLAKKALILNNNDINLAVEWLFSNPDDDGVIEISTETTTSKAVVNLAAEHKALKQKLLQSTATTSQTKYKLKSVICHKGTSPHTGHYVVFIRKHIEGKDKWILYNDEKVVICEDENLQDIKSNGYVYIFEKI
ncbi:hypothetical protein DFJ63DRAFT_310137 [Scheffersomyces coipomensis]|uniref:uncharacterized protein n=1 Tax=Scheffersomyces coipomensis TaxID=1788519 RepID=UPI00315DCF46